MNQDLAVQLLKKKGTGQTMGKHLSPDELCLCNDVFTSPEVHLTTKATLLTAFFMLEHNAEEMAWWNIALENRQTVFPEQCQFIFDASQMDSSDSLMGYASRLLKHEDLSYHEMTGLMNAILDTNQDEYKKAMCLEGLRLKRETYQENLACLDFYETNTHIYRCDMPILVALGNPYDGMTRYPNLTPFIAALLGSVGVPTYSYGCPTVAPKFGITTHQILTAAGKNSTKDMDDIVQDLSDPSIAWGYCDYRQFFPQSESWMQLRQNMVKRPVLATIEKYSVPIRSEDETVFVTGYTHPPYKQKSMDLCRSRLYLNQSLIIRGVEGSMQCPVDKRCRVIRVTKHDETEAFIDPPSSITETLSLDTVDAHVSFGLSCLRGQISQAMNPCLHTAAIILNQLSQDTQSEQMLLDSIESGRAETFWNKGCQ